MLAFPVSQCTAGDCAEPVIQSFFREPEVEVRRIIIGRELRQLAPLRAGESIPQRPAPARASNSGGPGLRPRRRFDLFL